MGGGWDSNVKPKYMWTVSFIQDEGRNKVGAVTATFTDSGGTFTYSDRLDSDTQIDDFVTEAKKALNKYGIRNDKRVLIETSLINKLNA